jgi:ankyrin repeat protein
MLQLIIILFTLPLCAMEEGCSNQNQLLQRLQALHGKDSALVEMKQRSQEEGNEQRNLEYISEIIRHLRPKYAKVKEFGFSAYGVNAKNENGETILCGALSVKCESVVRLLISAGANVNEPSGELKNTPLMYSVRGCQANITSLLLSHGADKKVSNKQGDTALVHALLYYHLVRWPIVEDDLDSHEVINQRLIIGEIYNYDFNLFIRSLPISKFTIDELMQITDDLWQPDPTNPQQSLYNPKPLNPYLFLKAETAKKRTYNGSTKAQNKKVFAQVESDRS